VHLDSKKSSDRIATLKESLKDLKDRNKRLSESLEGRHKMQHDLRARVTSMKDVNEREAKVRGRVCVFLYKFVSKCVM
jgi:predicted RNase H-like nuclease (RuvC/YqgF family)